MLQTGAFLYFPNAIFPLVIPCFEIKRYIYDVKNDTDIKNNTLI